MPDLASHRSQLERDLYRLLSPQQFPITAGCCTRTSLRIFPRPAARADVPLVHAASCSCAGCDHPLTQQEISWLLLSSTLGAAQGDAARDAMAHLDTKLRNARCAPPEMTLEASCCAAAKRCSGRNVTLPRSGVQCSKQHRRYRAAPPLQANGYAASRNLLRLARWGERSDASSLLFQAREAWDRLLDSVASLDFANGTYHFEIFLTALDRTAQETIFAPESQDAPVQVMGVYAAAGQSFDAVWFLGATDTAWPASGRPNPLLPLALQRELGMPHTSAADNTALAHRAMERIADSCGEVSTPMRKCLDEAMQRPSPLVSSFAPADVAIDSAIHFARDAA